MGVKTTVTLTRHEAEGLLTSLYIKRLLPLEVDMSDSELAELLEIWNDHDHQGDGHENYRIVK